MGGIAGIVGFDGAVAEQAVVERMATVLGCRTAAARTVQPTTSIALSYSPWRVDKDEGGQPLTLDGREWVVADARIDARQELVAALGLPCALASASDAELILRAYRAWGEDCVLHLLGDFAFAVWDVARRRLFCARDHLGVKPFYYAERGCTVAFSNRLDCVCSHPAVSRVLHDSAIADFLLFGANQDCGTTSFRDIRRLPPASSITWSVGAVRRRCYWTLPIDEPVRLRHARDYTERFVELLRAAVADRMPAGSVAILMSGGIDSTTLAAMAAQLVRGPARNGAVHAITSVYDRLIPDDERHYAGLAADHLRIPIHFDVRDDETSIADWNQVSVRTPEPVDNPAAFNAAVAFLTSMTAHARVFFYGEGPDNALRYEWRPYLTHAIGRGRLRDVARAVAGDLWRHPRVPLWSSIRAHAGAAERQRRWQRTFPSWLDEEFARHTDARARWEAFEQPRLSPHPLRPHGYESFAAARWQPLFEDCHGQGALAGAEFRHPYLDLRLLQYMLALPAMPWCRNKLIVRRAMRGRLPDAVLRRKKATLAGSADLARIATVGFPTPTWAPELSRYVRIDRLPSRPTTATELRTALRPLGLNYWLRQGAMD